MEWKICVDGVQQVDSEVDKKSLIILVRQIAVQRKHELIARKGGEGVVVLLLTELDTKNLQQANKMGEGFMAARLKNMLAIILFNVHHA